MPADIDQLTPMRSLIDLSSHSNGDFGLEDFILSKVYGDIVLAEYTDTTEDGDVIKRGSLYVHTNTLQKAWRKGRVILTGPGVRFTQVGDIIMFPNDRGVAISNVEIAGHGMVKRGIFLNEERIFGGCIPKDK